MSVQRQAVAGGPEPQLPELADEVPAYCARPSCFKQFTRTTKAGRPKAYCSETCRHAARNEYRQALARLAHYQSLVEQHRRLVALFGKAAEDGDGVTPASDPRAVAELALARASGAVRFLRESSDPAASELCALYDAVAPAFADACDW